MECEFPAFPGCPEVGSKVQLAITTVQSWFSLLGWHPGLSTHLTKARNSHQTMGHSFLPLSLLGAGGRVPSWAE